MQVQCEICAETIHARRTAARIDVDGTTRYFCCEACRRTFFEHPDLFPDALGMGAMARATTAG